MSMADLLPPGLNSVSASGWPQQLDKQVLVPGAQGYSSSGHSDVSQHLIGPTLVFTNSASREGSQDGVTAVPLPVIGTGAVAAVPTELELAVKPPSASPAPTTAIDTAPVDVGGRSGTPSPCIAPAPASPHYATTAVVKQEPGSPAAATAGSPKATASPRVQLLSLSPLPQPDPSDSPEVHAEYTHYMQRWQSGDTLAQRWHRLKEKGKWEEIRDDWEEWQQDMMLMQLQQQIATANKGKKRAKEDSEPDLDAPRQTRNRRAPATLQDYQVEAPAPSGPASREETPILGSKPRLAGGGRADPGSEDGSYSDGHEHEHSQRTRPQQQQLQQQQQQQVHMQQRRAGAAGGPGSRGAYRPPPPVIQQRPPQQRPPMHHPGQQIHQQWGRYGQQQQPGMMASMGHGADIQHQLYQMGTLMGQALHQAGGPAGGHAANMAAALEQFARMYGSDPAVFAQQMAAFHQQQQAHH